MLDTTEPHSAAKGFEMTNEQREKLNGLLETTISATVLRDECNTDTRRSMNEYCDAKRAVAEAWHAVHAFLDTLGQVDA